MSRYSGPQQRGADRQRRAKKRQQPSIRKAISAPEPRVLPPDVRNCPGKTKFASQELAEARARSINAMTGDDMHAYPCTACGWTHLGHVSVGTGRRHGRHYESAADRATSPGSKGMDCE